MRERMNDGSGEIEERQLIEGIRQRLTMERGIFGRQFWPCPITGNSMPWALYIVRLSNFGDNWIIKHSLQH